MIEGLEKTYKLSAQIMKLFEQHPEIDSVRVPHPREHGATVNFYRNETEAGFEFFSGLVYGTMKEATA